MFTISLIIIGGCFGAIATYYLQKIGLNAVIASCIVGLVGALIGYFFKTEDITYVIFAGSFVGMTAISITSLPIICIAGTLCGVLYLFTENHFIGYGGKLGAIAFVSLIIVSSLFWMFRKNLAG